MNGLLGPLEQELLLVLPPALDVASRPAILGEDGCDYAGLWDRVSATAGQLASFGVGPGQPVVVWLPKGTACMASILSVLRAGACYVPVDVTQPMTRVEVILDDVEPSAIITAPELAGLLGPRWSGLVVEPCDRATGTRPSPDPKLEPEDLGRDSHTHRGQQVVPRGSVSRIATSAASSGGVCVFSNRPLRTVSWGMLRSLSISAHMTSSSRWLRALRCFLSPTRCGEIPS